MCRPGDVVRVWWTRDVARVRGVSVTERACLASCPLCGRDILHTKIRYQRVWAWGSYTPGDTPGWYARYEPVSREDQVRV